ncbi:MAG: UDP-N-acetylmuramoyl-L-alanine--D-glutamate ligase [Candidatus Pacebacteria bacterium]|nr:UDP-N-acetylmuramoyl-L-alanine--D-glutamate ligase [Candidatus Paceibacterota bacterium]
MTIADLKKYRRILLLGYGREGKATESFLQKYVPNVEVFHADQTDNKDYLKKQYEADLVIKTAGLPRRLVKVPYTTATNIFFANVRDLVPNNRTIGITGSKGKSTTTSLLFSVLKTAGLSVRLAGNIGIPLLSELLKPPKENTIFVIEMSSYMLEDLQYSPNISVFLNIFPEHLDYHGSMQAYLRAKSQIALHAKKDDVFVYDSDHNEIAKLADQTKAKSIPCIATLPFSLDNVALKGKHNEQNIRMVCTVARLFDVPVDVQKKAIEQFVPLPHRLQNIGVYNGMTFYDDAIATAPEPTIAAIETLRDVDTIFLGGTDRGLNFSSLVEAICASTIRNIVFFPETGAKIREILEKKCNRTFTILETTRMKDAVAFAYKHTEKGKICLLSCASPSYTLWKNFEEKGDEFEKEVRTYGR